MAAPPPPVIGTIQTTTGVVTVVDASGVVAQVQVGDPVYRHDTIETGADGAVGITFTDGTAFNLSNNARMVLNQFVCDGTSNSALFSLSKGAFTFIAGKIAKTGGLRIDTPFARIRGAAQDGGIGILTLAALAFSTLREIQAASRSDAFLDDGTITYKDSPHGTFEITTRDGRVIVADDPGETVVVDPAGSVTRIPNSSSRMAELQQAQQNALNTLSMGLGQQGAAPGGSSTDTFNTPLQLQPINFSQPQNNDPGPTHVTINITPTTQGFIEIPQSKPPSAPAPAPPPESTIAINTIAGDIAIAGVNIINAGKANTGFDITGTTNGQMVTLTILDSSGQVKDTHTTMVANNVWSVNVSSPDARSLADGSYTVTAIVSDAPGNQLVQATQTFAVHETLPTVTINALAANGGNVINHAEAQAGVTLSGTVTGLAAGATFAISVAEGSFTHSYTATVNAQGTGWTTTIPPADATTLKDGTLTVTAQVTDQFGNQSVQATQTFTVHELPTVTISAQDGDGDNVITHAEAQGGVTLIGTVTGLAAGAKFNITVADGSFTHSYTATVNAQGTGWTTTIPPADATTLKDGTLTVTAQVTDQFGNQSVQATQTFTVHELPTVTISVQDGDGDNVITHAEAQGGVTLSGTVTGLAAGATFNITVADGSFTHSYTATVNAKGTGWTATIPPADATTLKDGTLTVTAQVTDQFGNQSEQAAQAFAVDETLPTVTISGISPDTGSSASDGITNVAVVTVSGTTKANSTVKLFDDGNQAGTAIADSTGHWSVTNVTLSEGVNDLTAIATDATGNVSAVSATFVATLDQDTGERLAVNFNGLTGGDAVEDQTITAIVTDTDNDVPTSGITYTWQLSHDGGNTWSTVGANTPTYTPGEDDEGGLLKVLASFTDAAGNTESGSSTVGVLPLLTIANNSLLVSPNGSVSLGVSLTQEPTPDDTISVTISFPSSGAHDPTIAAGDHATGNPNTSGGITTYTFSVADVNSGLTITNHGDPVDTLTVQEILNGDIVATSKPLWSPILQSSAAARSSLTSPRPQPAKTPWCSCAPRITTSSWAARSLRC